MRVFFLRIILTLINRWFSLHVFLLILRNMRIQSLKTIDIVSFCFKGCSYNALIWLHPFPDQEFTWQSIRWTVWQKCSLHHCQKYRQIHVDADDFFQYFFLAYIFSNNSCSTISWFLLGKSSNNELKWFLSKGLFIPPAFSQDMYQGVNSRATATDLESDQIGFSGLLDMYIFNFVINISWNLNCMKIRMILKKLFYPIALCTNRNTIPSFFHSARLLFLSILLKCSLFH